VIKVYNSANNKWRITINRSPSAPILFAITGTANDDIEYIRVTNDGTVSGSDIWLIIGPNIRNVDEISRVGNSTDKPTSVIQMSISGNCGSVFVNRFQNVQIGGNLSGQLIVAPPYASTAQPNDIVVGGNVTSNILNDGGSIGSIEVAGAIVGPSGNTIRITASDAIESIVAGSIHNAVIGHPASFSYLDSLGSLEVEGDFTWDGVFPTNGIAGVVAQSIGSIRIGGDLGCVIRVDTASGLPSGQPNTVSIDIGGSLLSNGLLSIVNAANGSGAIDGAVRINGIDLSPLPEYSRSPLDAASGGFGGGAVGLAPFHLHRHASHPVDGAVIDPSSTPSNSNPILMRHYVPVEWTGETKPFIVKRRNAATGEDTTDETDCFDMMPIDSTNHTIVRVVPNEGYAFLRGFEYIVERRQVEGVNVLRCDLPSGATPPVFDYDPLTFTVCEKGDAALGDADNSGCVNFADITSVITNWLSTACGKLGDANRDGDVNFADITTVLISFGSEYCGDCEGGESFGGSASLESALTALGYESLGAFLADLDGMTLSEQRALIQDLIDTAD
jgi:hypothetical protein